MADVPFWVGRSYVSWADTIDAAVVVAILYVHKCLVAVMLVL
jgi:hypothetical protein